MNEPNTQILSRLQQLNCNTVFISFKVSQDKPNNNNLGLYVYNPSANFSGYSEVYCYRDKLTDFIHLASSLPVPIKVFALKFKNSDEVIMSFQRFPNLFLLNINKHLQNIIYEKKTLFPITYRTFAVNYVGTAASMGKPTAHRPYHQRYCFF